MAIKDKDLFSFRYNYSYSPYGSELVRYGAYGYDS